MIELKIEKIEKYLKEKNEIEYKNLKGERQIGQNWEQVLNTLLNQIGLNNPKYSGYYSSELMKKLLRKGYNLEEIYIYLNKEIKEIGGKTIFDLEKDFKENLIENELIINKDIWEIEKVCGIYIKKLFWINSYFGIKKEIEIEDLIKESGLNIRYLKGEEDNKFSLDIIILKEKFICGLQIKPISFLKGVKYGYGNYNKNAYFKNLKGFENSELDPIFFIIYDKKGNIDLYDISLNPLNLNLNDFIKLIKKEDLKNGEDLKNELKIN